jgi:hypothetical protein
MLDRIGNGAAGVFHQGPGRNASRGRSRINRARLRDRDELLAHPASLAI